jgi:hypothetical protein
VLSEDEKGGGLRFYMLIEPRYLKYRFILQGLAREFNSKIAFYRPLIQIPMGSWRHERRTTEFVKAPRFLLTSGLCVARPISSWRCRLSHGKTLARESKTSCVIGTQGLLKDFWGKHSAVKARERGSEKCISEVEMRIPRAARYQNMGKLNGFFQVANFGCFLVGSFPQRKRGCGEEKKKKVRRGILKLVIEGAKLFTRHAWFTHLASA